VFEEGGVTFCYVQHNNLYLLAVTRLNTNAMAVVSFLHSLITVFAHYFGELEEESLRDNFVICYELLDEVPPTPHTLLISRGQNPNPAARPAVADASAGETDRARAQVMDYGHPQFTEANILKEFITTHAHKLEASAAPRPPMAVTGAVSWRSDGIRYKKNEVRAAMPAPSIRSSPLSAAVPALRALAFGVATVRLT